MPLIQHVLFKFFSGASEFVPGGSGDLVANPEAILYLTQPEDSYLPDAGELYLPVTYKEMTWITRFEEVFEHLPADVVLDVQIDGTWSILYRYGSNPIYLGGPVDNDEIYLGGVAADGDPYLPGVFTEDFSGWPGRVPATLSNPHFEFKVVTAAGAIQGRIKKFNVLIDVPDESEVLNNVAIDSAGTRLPITKNYRTITSVQLTLFDDEGTGHTAKTVDYNADLGPLVKVFDITDTAVDGTVTAHVQGAKA